MLDLNRGVTTRKHPSGVYVSQYDDDPGTYLDPRGKPVAPELAKQAGFDIEKDKVAKLKLLKLAEYKKQLDAEYATAEETLARELSKNGGHDIRHVGADQYAVFNADGKRVAVGTKDEIELLFGPVKTEAA